MSEERLLRTQIAEAEGQELHALLVRWKDLRMRAAVPEVVEPAVESEGVVEIDLGEEDEFAFFEQTAAAAPGGVGGDRGWSFFGRLASKIAVDTNRENRFEDYFDWRTELRFGVDLEWSKETSVRLSGEALHQLHTGDKSEWEWETDLHEAYVDHRYGPYDIRIGQQIVSWGRADAINPTDNLNPQDFREVVTIHADDRKIPIPMVRVRRMVERGDVDFIYIPFFEPHEFDIVGADFALMGPGLLPEEWEEVLIKLAERFRSSRVTYSGDSLFRVDEPEEKLTNGEVGLRWSTRVGRVDGSLSFLYTYEDMPSFSLDLEPLHRFNLKDEDTRRFLENAEVSDLLRLRKLFKQEFQRQWIVGVDFETLVGRYSLRGEAALTVDATYYRKSLERVEKPVFSWVIGGDRTLPGEVYTNLQLLQTVLLRYDSDIITERVRTGMTGTLRRRFLDDRLGVKVDTLFFFRDEDYFLNFQVDYDATDNLNVAAGVNIFQGERDDALLQTATISRFINNDHVYSRLLYHF